MKDEQIRDSALAAFCQQAPAKFNAGIQEHNPNGDKGLWRLPMEELVKHAKEEVVDLWHYLHAMELKLAEKRESYGFTEADRRILWDKARECVEGAISPPSVEGHREEDIT